jgi:hypothetical protein
VVCRWTRSAVVTTTRSIRWLKELLEQHGPSAGDWRRPPACLAGQCCVHNTAPRMVKLSERFSFQVFTDALGSLGRFHRTDVTRRYERKQIILNVTSSALLGNSKIARGFNDFEFLDLTGIPVHVDHSRPWMAC